MAELGVLYFLGGLLTLIAGGFIIFILYSIYGNKERPKNEDYIINGFSDYTDGHGLLIKKEEESNKSIVRLNGSPRDIDYIELEDSEKEIKNQDIFPKKDLFVPFPISAHRNFFIALPDEPEHLPAKFKKSPLYPYIAQFIVDQNSKEDTKIVKDTRLKNMLKMTKQTEGLGIAKESIQMYSETIKGIRDLNRERVHGDKNE